MKKGAISSGSSDVEHYLLGSRLATANPTCESTTESSDIEYMRDHFTLAGTVYPAAAYADIHTINI